MMTEMTQDKSKLSITRVLKLLNCGFLSGLTQAGVFHPWDRALYLSVKNNVPFLQKQNFVNPMAGVFQTLFQRGMSVGLYFPLEDVFDALLRDALVHSTDSYSRASMFLSGLLAGAVNGLVMNPFARIKYQYWGRSQTQTIQGSFIKIGVDMFKQGGLRPFFVGASATIQRDVVFGAFYAILRHELASDTAHAPGMNQFSANVVAASVATILSSPYNYIRNMNYATPPGISPKSGSSVMLELWRNAMQETTLRTRLSHVQSRLRIGWGTARVGCGMAVSAKLYSLCSKFVN